MSFTTRYPARHLLSLSVLILTGCGGVTAQPPAPTGVVPFDDTELIAGDHAQLQAAASGSSGILLGTLRADGSQVEFGTLLAHPTTGSTPGIVPHGIGVVGSARLEIAVDAVANEALGVVSHIDDSHTVGLVFPMDSSGNPLGVAIEVPAGATLPLVQEGLATFLSTDAASGATTIFLLVGGEVTPVATVMLPGHPVARLALSKGSAIITAKRTGGYLLDALTLVRLDTGGHVLDARPLGTTLTIDEATPVLGVARDADGSAALAVVPDYVQGHGAIVTLDPTGTVDPSASASFTMGNAATAISLARLEQGGFLVVALQDPSTGYALEAYRLARDGTSSEAPYRFPDQKLVGGTSMYALPYEDRALVIHDVVLGGGEPGITVDAMSASP
jgi:hypothetical protein